MTQNKENFHYLGHRKRMKDKSMSSDMSVLTDYEIMELLLFFAIPRKDVKPLAKNMLKIFSSFNNILSAEKEDLLGFDDVNTNTIVLLKTIKEILNRIFKERVKGKNVVSSWSELMDYLIMNMSYLKIEYFRVLFLNKKNVLISDDIISKGTVDESYVYPRELIKKAILYGATAIILVHNHPGNTTNPSKADIALTKQIRDSCKIVNIELHDHVIISNNRYYSFKENYLL